MLSPADFNNAVPQFTNGTYASNPINPQYVNEPTSTEYNQGVEPLQTLPAQWWNWFLNKFTGRFNKINTYVKNIFNELTELLSLSNITPDGTEATPTTCQLKDMFASCYPDYVKCCTTGTACGCIPVIGSELCCEANHIVVTDTNGNLKPTSFTVGTAAGCDASCFMPAGVASCSSYLFCCYTVGDTPATFREFCKYVCIYDDECVSVINLRGCSYHGRRYCWECVPINVDSACYSCKAALVGTSSAGACAVSCGASRIVYLKAKGVDSPTYCWRTCVDIAQRVDLIQNGLVACWFFCNSNTCCAYLYNKCDFPLLVQGGAGSDCCCCWSNVIGACVGACSSANCRVYIACYCCCCPSSYKANVSWMSDLKAIIVN